MFIHCVVTERNVRCRFGFAWRKTKLRKNFTRSISCDDLEDIDCDSSKQSVYMRTEFYSQQVTLTYTSVLPSFVTAALKGR